MRWEASLRFLENYVSKMIESIWWCSQFTMPFPLDRCSSSKCDMPLFIIQHVSGREVENDSQAASSVSNQQCITSTGSCFVGSWSSTKFHHKEHNCKAFCFDWALHQQPLQIPSPVRMPGFLDSLVVLHHPKSVGLSQPHKPSCVFSPR